MHCDILGINEREKITGGVYCGWIKGASRKWMDRVKKTVEEDIAILVGIGNVLWYIGILTKGRKSMEGYILVE